MKPSTRSASGRSRRAAISAALCVALVLPPLAARGAPTPLAETPLQALNRVKPNIMFTLDDSGSMAWEFLPDYTAGGYPRGATPWPDPFPYYCRDRINCGGVDLEGGEFLIVRADPPLRSSAYNKVYYDPSAAYYPGRTDAGKEIPCEGTDTSCAGPWTKVYVNGFDYYFSGPQSTTIDLTTRFPDTVWCSNKTLQGGVATKAEIDTAYTDGSKCRLNGRAYPATTTTDAAGASWTVPAIAAGYNYPNFYNTVTGSATSCASGDACVFNRAATVYGNPYYYTIANLQFCKSADAARFGLSSCGSRWDETDYRYVRYGTGTQGFDPRAFTRVDIVNGGFLVNGVPAANPSGRSYAQEMANFAKWYAFYRTRMLAMKTAGGIAFSVLSDENSRVGFHTLNSLTFLNVKPFDTAHKQDWFRAFYGIVPTGSTPLPNAMWRVGEYFAQSGRSGLPSEADPLDKVIGRCQPNYHLLSTDGYWNQSLTGDDVGNRDRTVPSDLPGPIPGFVPGSVFPRPYYEGPKTSTNSLADLAMHYWIRDLRPDFPDNVKDTIAPWQHVTLYGLSIGTEGSVVYPTGVDDIVRGTRDWPQPQGQARPDSIDDLWHAALNSRGKYYNARDPRELAESIVSALSDFTSQSGTGTGIGIASAQFSATRKYGYRTSYESGNWGDVKKYELDPNTGALPAKPDGNPTNDPLWSAATQLDAQALGRGWDDKRRIVTVNASSGAAVPFRLGSLAAAQQAALAAGWSIVPGAPGAQAVLDYLRGDRSNEGIGTTNFRTRSRLLGDIVYSGAVPVGAPAQPYDQAGNPGYPAFAAAKKGRTPMVYAGANDGMLHAFVDSTTADAGKEAWAYVPKALFEGGKLAALSFRRGGIPQFSPRFLVNATPRVWDIDFANTNTSSPPQVGNDWRTILVGGLGAGGRAVYALDVTTPVALSDTEADIVASKRVLWEFTDANLGYVYDAPTLVKTRRYGWVVLVVSGYNNPGGKGILYVLNPTDGTILRKLSTDVGDNDNPSGLSTIRAYTASRRDPYVLQAYGGDLRGNVWRFDLSDPDERNWKVELIAKLTDPRGKPQPITTGVRVEIDQNNNVDRYLFVGTGKLLHQDDLDDASVTNTLYVIRDGTRTAAEPAPAKPYSRADLNAVTGMAVGGFTGKATGRGWYQDASDAKQKVATDVYADVQTVVFTFSKPADDSCEGALTSTLYARDFLTGASVLESPGGTVVASVADVGAIAGTALIQGQPGGASATSGGVRAQVTTMKGQVFSFGVKLPGASTPRHRVSWRLLTRD